MSIKKEELVGIQKLHTIDRRILWVTLILLSTAAIIRPVGIPVVIIDDVRFAYNSIEALPVGSVVHIDIAFNPGSLAPVGTMFADLINHCLMRGLKIVFTTGVGAYGTTSTPYIYNQLISWGGVENQIENLEYGEDWVYLGYLGASDTDYLSFYKDIWFLGTDYYGTPLEDLPIMQSLETYDDIDFTICGGSLETNAATVIRTLYGTSIIKIIGPGSIPDEKIFVPAIYSVVLGGVSRAGQYELLIKQPGEGVRAIDNYMVAQLVIVAFVMLGNIGYYAWPGRKEETQ